VTDRSRVLVSRRVPATAERAFAAFTADIGRWWRPNGLFELNPGRRGHLAFEPGADGRLVEHYDDGTTFVVGSVLAWEPPHHLALQWRQATFGPGQSTELHVRFDDVDGLPGEPPQARVTIEHFGWDQFPPEHAARHGFALELLQRRFAEWWQELLRSLL
jgi:uncharacterized protein YndB with AHSA1/START domain